MKGILACAAVVLSCGEAMAQLQVVETPDFERCREFRVSNPTNRHYVISIDYQYIGGTDFQGGKRDWVWQTNGTIPPYATVVVGKQAVPMIDCSKGYRFAFQYRIDDITAKREEIDRSREEVIRKYVEAEEAKKRQAEEYARQQQAEADARALKAAEQQAARDAARQRVLDLQTAQKDLEMDALRQRIREGDRRCDILFSPTDRPEEVISRHNQCLRNVEESDRLAPRYEIGEIDPATCYMPNMISSNLTEQMHQEAYRKAELMVEECKRRRAAVAPAFAGPDPAVLEAERLRAEQAETQRLLALEREETARQLAAQQAQMEAEQRAFMLQQAQQSMTQSTNELRASNADFARQTQDIRDANAELEAFLNGN